jgi:3-oxoacyl-ACP reductase-like protein
MANDPLKAQLDAQAAQIAQLQRQVQVQTRAPAPAPAAQVTPPAAAAAPAAQPQYQQVDQATAILNHLVGEASKKVVSDLGARDGAQSKIKMRMERLLKDYPALGDDDSALVTKAREYYARIQQENPGLDEATRYEVAVQTAAAYLGARPVTAPAVDLANSDWTMPTGKNNPSLPRKQTKSRLTPAIIQNARLMGINVDPNSAEGKKNLEELSEYSARFNADQDESQYRYQ